MPVHRAFDVMAPMDVHSARCLAIQPGRAAGSPPRAGRNFLGMLKTLKSLYFKGVWHRPLRRSATLRDGTPRKHPQSRRGKSGEFVRQLF